MAQSIVNPPTADVKAPTVTAPESVTEPAPAPASETAPPSAAKSFQSASLYIGDLHVDVNEAILFSQFSSVGTVISIRVCRDTVTRTSLGYAYVNFEKVEDAEAAFEQMNFELLHGKPMRIMWSQRDPSLRRSGAGNVFIKNMDKSIDTKAIYDTFSMFGNILSCKVATDSEGNSKGYGFIHFETEESANKASERVNGMLLDGKKVYVGKFVQKDSRQKGELGEKDAEFTNIFVKNFEDKFDDEDLRTMFEKFGQVTSAIVMKEEDGKSKGFGFVCFANPEDAKVAVEGLNDSIVPNSENKLYVGRAQKKYERVSDLRMKHESQKQERIAQFAGVNLYVKNLDDCITDDQLREQFEGYGKITSSRIMRDEQDRSKGFGFVCFESSTDATNAVTEMNGKMFGTRPLYVVLAQRKEERRAQLATHYMHRVNNMGRQYSQNMMAPNMYPNGNNSNGYFVAQQIGGPVNRSSYPQNGMNQGQKNAAPRWNSMTQQGGNFNQGGYTQGGSYMMPQGNYPGNQIRGNRPTNNGPRQYNNQGGQGGQGGPRMTGSNMVQSNNMRGPPMSKPMQGNYYAGNMQQPIRGPMGQHQQDMSAPQRIPAQEKLTSQMLTKASPQEQKQMIGERIFPLVSKYCKDVDAGKLTGMMLEMDVPELLMILDNDELLQAKVGEAIFVLRSATPAVYN
uniref:Polyadenylate-binding protein n=1 Tax=Rhabditophanes sp. KR3021 TaxID=114890 RepID=A0AC35TYG7_9BILA